MPFATRKNYGSLKLWISCAAMTLLFAAGSVLLVGDGLLQSQFQSAFKERQDTKAPSSQLANHAAPVIGTEDFWLGDARRSHATPAAWHSPQPLSAGDKITMAIKGSKRLLEVVAVKSLNAAALTGASGSAHSLLITLRPADGSKGADMHILIDQPEELPPVAKLIPSSHEL